MFLNYIFFENKFMHQYFNIVDYFNIVEYSVRFMNIKSYHINVYK